MAANKHGSSAFRRRPLTTFVLVQLKAFVDGRMLGLSVFGVGLCILLNVISAKDNVLVKSIPSRCCQSWFRYLSQWMEQQLVNHR